jgi:cell wall-associated NlpC family hydrolase
MGKQIHLCAIACFLLSVLLFSCQTERKTNHSSNAVSKAAGKQGANNNKLNNSINHNTAPKKYYAANKQPVNTAPKPVIHTPEVIPQTAVIEPVAIAVPETKNAIPEKTTTDQTHEVTIIIKDSVAPKDRDVATVTKSDTIQFNEPNKDEAGEPDQAATEDAAPLTPEEMDTVISKYAEMISVDRSEMSNFNLYLFIDEWYGTRYKWGGTDSTGIDCSAFSQKLYGKVYGVDILRTARQQHHHAERVKYPDDANEGDLVFFRIHHLRVSHVGVYLANGFFVHSSSSKGVMISNLNDRYWRRRFAGCGRIAKEEKSITESDYLQ